MNPKEQPINTTPLTKEEIREAWNESLDIHRPNEFDKLVEMAEKDAFKPDMKDIKKINAALKKYENMSIDELDKEQDKSPKSWGDKVKKEREEKETTEKSR